MGCMFACSCHVSQSPSNLSPTDTCIKPVTNPSPPLLFSPKPISLHHKKNMYRHTTLHNNINISPCLSYTHTYTHNHTRIHTHLYTYTYIYIHTHTYRYDPEDPDIGSEAASGRAKVSMCVCVCECVHVCVSMCVCMRYLLILKWHFL